MRLAQQVIVDKFGGPDVLRVVDVPVLAPAPGQLLVRVKAAGVLYGDVMRRTDRYLFPTQLPYAPGTEVAGIVEEVGADVQSHRPGDRVVSYVPSGGYAQFATMDASSAVALPPEIGFADATALLAQGATAYLLTHDAAVIRGKSVFIESAAGGVGMQMVQFARKLGASFIVGSASSQIKRDHAKRNGADLMVDPTDPSWHVKVLDATNGLGIGVGFESSGANFQQLLKCLAAFGTLVKFGRGVDEHQTMDPTAVVSRNQSIRGFYLPGYRELSDTSLLKNATSNLIKAVLDKELVVHVSDRYPLEHVELAHAVVLEPWRSEE
jgi:NADPH2:quinone reductase